MSFYTKVSGISDFKGFKNKLKLTMRIIESPSYTAAVKKAPFYLSKVGSRIRKPKAGGVGVSSRPVNMSQPGGVPVDLMFSPPKPKSKALPEPTAYDPFGSYSMPPPTHHLQPPPSWSAAASTFSSVSSPSTSTSSSLAPPKTFVPPLSFLHQHAEDKRASPSSSPSSSLPPAFRSPSPVRTKPAPQRELKELKESKDEKEDRQVSPEPGAARLAPGRCHNNRCAAKVKVKGKSNKFKQCGNPPSGAADCSGPERALCHRGKHVAKWLDGSLELY